MNHMCILCNNSGKKLYEISNILFFHCDVCDIIFKSPQNFLTQSEQKTRYQTHKNSPEDIQYKNFLNTLLSPLKKYLKPKSLGLDYGCGPGPTVSYLLETEGFCVENFDPSFFNDKNLLEKKYDFVTCTEVVEHFTDPKNHWAELIALLQPGSTLGIMTEFYENKDFKNWYYKNDPTHVVFYSHKSMKYIAEKQNLKILEIGERYCVFEKN